MSPGATSDDKIHSNIDHIIGQYGTITEKRDGENLSMNCVELWARSIDSTGGSLRSRALQLHSQIKHDIPDGMVICGENLQYEHSLGYKNLKSVFEVFAIFYEGRKLKLEEALEWCTLLGLTHVPVMYHGIITEKIILDTIKSLDTTVQEGFVVSVDGFKSEDYTEMTAKYVRSGHVTTDEHWKKNPKENTFILCCQ